MATREERQMARQRGAATHKVQSTGFTINLPGVIGPPPSALSLASQSAMGTSSEAIRHSPKQSTALQSVSKTPRSAVLKRTPAPKTNIPMGPKGPVNTLGNADYDPIRSILKDGLGKKRKSVEGDEEPTDPRNVSFADEPDSGAPTPLAKRRRRSSSVPEALIASSSSSRSRGTRKGSRSRPAIAVVTPVPRGKRKRQPGPEALLESSVALRTSPRLGSLMTTSTAANVAHAEDSSVTNTGRVSDISPDQSLESVIESARTAALQISVPKDRRRSLRTAVPVALRSIPPQSKSIITEKHSQATSDSDHSGSQNLHSDANLKDRSSHRSVLGGLSGSQHNKQRRPRQSSLGEDQRLTETFRGVPKARSKRQPEVEGISAQSRSTVPIQVLRFARRVRPTSSELQENPQELPNKDGPFSIEIPSRTSPNGIDVLSQLCREIVQSCIERIRNPKPRRDRQSSASASSSQSQELGLAASTKVRSRQVAALRLFGEELDLQLMRMSETLDAALVVQTQLRDRRKEISSKESELLQIKGRREEIRVQVADIRWQHEIEDEEAKRFAIVNRGFEDVTVAVERSGEMTDSEAADEQVEQLRRKECSDGLVPVGIESRIEAMKETVCTGRDTGILTKIRAFNNYLERMVTLDFPARL